MNVEQTSIVIKADETLRKVSELLASTLDLESILTALRTLLVPAYCDAMSLNLADLNGQLELPIWHGVSPEKTRLQNEMVAKYHKGEKAYPGPAAVFKTGVPRVLPFIDDVAYANTAQTQEHFEILKKLNFRSFLCVPLKSRNRNVGVASFLQSESGRRFSLEDLPFFQEIAYRAAMAIENARLFEEKKVQADGFHALAETIPHKVWVGKPDGTLIFVNQRWLNYTGLIESNFPHDMEGWNRVLIHPEDIERMLKEIGEALKSSSEYEVEVRCRRHDGEYLWHNVHGVAVLSNDGILERWVCTITDINERKLTELALKEAKDAAESSSRAKSTFLINISHEIRTPLNSIIGYSELLKEEGVAAAERSEMLGVVIRNGKAVAQIINDILDLSKVEAGKLAIEPKPIVIADLLRDVSEVFEVTTKAKGILLSVRQAFPSSTVLLTDPARLRQILLNLVGNAVKFTHTGRIEIEVEPVGKEQIVFRVKDTGIGISSKDQKSLFEPFAQADSSLTRRYGGTGLRLALSRRLAQAMGGNVVLESSELGKGSSFACYLKSDLVAPRPLGTLDSSTAQGVQGLLRNRHVLVVEDSIDSQNLVKRILEKQLAVVDSAMNGKEGAEKALAKRYDLILMDIQMPVMNGYEATTQIRADGYAGPILALTAHALAEERQKCLSLGFTDYLTKPIDKKVLFEVIEKHLSNH